MENIKKEREFLLEKLLEITVKKSLGAPTITVIATGSGNPVVLNYLYNEREFGFPPNRFVKYDGKVLLCLGVGDDCNTYGQSLWFVARGYNGAIVFEKKRAAYFEAQGFQLLDEN